MDKLCSGCDDCKWHKIVEYPVTNDYETECHHELKPSNIDKVLDYDEECQYKTVNTIKVLKFKGELKDLTTKFGYTFKVPYWTKRIREHSRNVIRIHSKGEVTILNSENSATIAEFIRDNPPLKEQGLFGVKKIWCFTANFKTGEAKQGRVKAPDTDDDNELRDHFETFENIYFADDFAEIIRELWKNDLLEIQIDEN